MRSKFERAGIATLAAISVLVLAGAAGTGAFAQMADASSAADAAGPAPASDPLEPRFVAEAVVQPLPGNSPPNGSADPAAGKRSLRDLVAATPAGLPLSRDMRCLAEAIYFEARGEPLAGQLAVGQVIVNRVESPHFPDDYCAVVTQPGQFSFVRGGEIPAIPADSSAWQRAKAVARIAHEESWDNQVEDALYFHATHVRPRWASRKLARATIEGHIFYR